MTYHEHLANLSLWLWTQMANHLWQSTLFLLLASAVVAILRKAAAKLRYTVWLIASAKFVLPLSLFTVIGGWLNLNGHFSRIPIVERSLPSSLGIVDMGSFDSASTAVISTAQAANNHNEIYCFLTFLWLIGCSALFALWLKRSRNFKKLLGYKNTSLSEREAELLNNARLRVGLTAAHINLIVSDSILEPVVLGIRQPTVVMPKGLSQKLTDDEFESVLMHELAHVRRRDNLVGILQMALCCLLWFHPLVWLVKRKLLEERERACDETVLRCENKPLVYAAGLLKVVQYGLHSHQSAGIANAAGTNLTKRLELIMENKIRNTNAKWQQWMVGLTMTILVLICIVSGFAVSRAGNAVNPEHLTDSVGDNQPEIKFRVVEIHAEGKLFSRMKLGSPKPNAAMFSYALYRIPEGLSAQNSDGQRIYAFQIIPVQEADSVKVETLALLEDLNTLSNAHPLHEFKKQIVASYSLRNGESVVISEMSRLGVKPLEIKITEATATEYENPKNGYTFKTVTILKGEELPDVSYKIVGNEDCPLQITEATGQAITNTLYTKLTGQTTVTSTSGKAAVLPNVYSAPAVKMINNSGKTITGLILSVVDPRPVGSGKVRLILQGKPSAPHPISISPGASYTVNFGDTHSSISEKYWLEFTDPKNFYVTIGQVEFDDGTTWRSKETIYQ